MTPELNVVDLEPSRYHPELWVYRYGKEDSTLKSGFVSERRALWLVLGVNDYLHRYLGVNDVGFLSAIDERTLQSDGPVPLQATPAYQGVYPHWWVWDSPPHALLKTRGSLFRYFTSLEEARNASLESIRDGYDSYYRGAASAGEPTGRNNITRDLFSSGLFYALEIAMHEPLHPILGAYVGSVRNYGFEESMVTFFSQNLIIPFLQEYGRDLGGTDDLIEEAGQYFNRRSIADKFLRLSYFRMERMYASNTRPNVLRRLPEEEIVLQQISDVWNNRQHVGSRVTLNNAFLHMEFAYTGSLLIADFVSKYDTDVKRFIADKRYRDMIMPRLYKYFSTRLYRSPRRLERKWNGSATDLIKLDGSATH